MKYLLTFENHVNFQDIDKIQEIILDKGIDVHNTDWFVNEIDLIKNNQKVSVLYNIVDDYYNHTVTDKGQIILFLMKFLNYRYPESIEIYKEKLKTEQEKVKIKRNNKHKITIPFGDTTLEVPSLIGHKYRPIKAVPIEELYTTFKDHSRLRVFANKGLKCVSPGCDREGKYIIYAKAYDGAIHIDLYTKDFVLMTIDHIKPKSLGGGNNIENLDPMCTYCNARKGSIYKENS